MPSPTANLEIESPWLFELRTTGTSDQKRTHAGVLEFIADEGNVHLPAWVSASSISYGLDSRAQRRGLGVVVLCCCPIKFSMEAIS